MRTKTVNIVLGTLAGAALVAGSLATGVAIGEQDDNPQPTDTASCLDWAAQDGYGDADSASLCHYIWNDGWDIEEMQYRQYTEARDDVHEFWETIMDVEEFLERQ